MKTQILLATILCFVVPCAPAQNDTGPASDVAALHQLIEGYAKAADTLDVNLISQVWSPSPEVTLIYPLGEEHGYDAIEKHFFENLLGGTFSSRHLVPRGVAIHVNGDAAWSEFRWTFHATMRKDGSPVTTRGVETQVYRKEAGQWRLVHVHYSEDEQAAP